jgi:antitoxin CcdA
MNHIYSRDAPKRRTNLTINEDLVRAAKEMGLNLSEIAEEALTAAVRERARKQWEKENAEALEVHRHRVEAHGTFGDLVRRF